MDIRSKSVGRYHAAVIDEVRLWFDLLEDNRAITISQITGVKLGTVHNITKNYTKIR